MDYATTLLAAVLLGVGFVLQQFAAEQEPESRFLHLRILTDLLRKPRWLLGIGCMVAGYLLAAWSIGHLEQHGGQQGGRIVHIRVHGALFSLVRKCAGIKDNAQY